MDQVLAKYFSDEATPEEIVEIEKWRAESDENAELFLQSKEAFIASGQIKPAPPEALDQILAASAPRGKSRSLVFLKYAAAIAILMVFAIGVMNSINSRTPLVAFGDNSIQKLDDGSLVTLPKGASIEINFEGNVRKVMLTGKAYFEVEPNPDKPFQVVAKNGVVEVLGTAFQVDTQNDMTRVIVEEGVVAFRKSENSNMEVRLEKGDMGLARKASRGIIKRKDKEINSFAWVSGRLVFERTKLEDVERTLEEVYGKEIILPENTKNCRLTAIYEQKSLKEVIEIISLTYNWSYEINKDKVVLSGKGC